MKVPWLKYLSLRINSLIKALKYNSEENLNQTIFKLKNNGFEIINKRNVSIKDLVVINLPKCYHSDLFKGDLSQFSFLDDLLKNDDGRIDRSISNSMHLKFLNDYFYHNIDYKDTLYWKMRKEYQKVGLSPESDKIVRKQLDSLIELCYSLMVLGFQDKYFSNNLFVLEKPFITTRYGVKYDPGGYEMWFGHHRAAVLWFLEKKEVPVYFLRDIMTKSTIE